MLHSGRILIASDFSDAPFPPPFPLHGSSFCPLLFSPTAYSAFTLKAQIPPLPVCSGLRARSLTHLPVAAGYERTVKRSAVRVLSALSGPVCLGSGVVSCNEAVQRVAPDGPPDASHFLLFVAEEDGGWRLVPTSDSLGVFCACFFFCCCLFCFVFFHPWRSALKSVGECPSLRTSTVTCSAPQVGHHQAGSCRRT